RLADPFLELAPADWRAFAGGACLYEPQTGLGRLLAHQGLEPDRVAQTGKAVLAEHDHLARRGQHDAVHRADAAGQVDDDPDEFAAQFVEQHVDRAGVDGDVLRRGGLGCQHAQIIADLDHGALDKQAVDARRLLQGLAQAAARVEVELQSDGPEMQVEIDERDPLTLLGGHQPGAGNGRGRRADPAPAADEHDYLPQPIGGRSYR